jgi:hypothetical protein
MGKTWLLDTETKGTGAQMVPLDKALERKRGAPKGERFSVIKREREEPRDETTTGDEAPITPRRFRVLNVITRRVVADDVEARELVELLAEARSVADVQVYVREDSAGEWRPLSLREQIAMRRYAV